MPWVRVAPSRSPPRLQAGKRAAKRLCRYLAYSVTVVVEPIGWASSRSCRHGPGSFHDRALGTPRAVSGSALTTQADTNTGTRRCKIHGLVLTLVREPIYLEATTLPPHISNDPYIEVEVVETAPPGVEVTRLKAERAEELTVADTVPTTAPTSSRPSGSKSPRRPTPSPRPA